MDLQPIEIVWDPSGSMGYERAPLAAPSPQIPDRFRNPTSGDLLQNNSELEPQSGHCKDGF